MTACPVRRLARGKDDVGNIQTITSPLVNEYGCLHTSQDFFLLWASHVVKLVEMIRNRYTLETNIPLPILVDIAYGARAFAGMKKRLVGLCRSTANTTGI